MQKKNTSKTQSIKDYKNTFPTSTSKQIAESLGLQRGYVSHILWKAKQPSQTKNAIQKSYQDLLIQNNFLKSEIELLEKRISELNIVIKYLKDN